MAGDNKKLDIYTFLAFEKQVASDFFYNNSISLKNFVEFHVFNKKTFKRDDRAKIFLGICAGNPFCTQKGEIYVCKSVTTPNCDTPIEVFSEIDFGLEKCDFLYTQTAINTDFKWPAHIKVADMETMDVIRANTQYSNIFRIVCDHGVEHKNFSLTNYKKEILAHYTKGLRILRDKILYLV